MPRDLEGAVIIRLRSADAQAERKLRRLRDCLSAVTGTRAPDHNECRFRITLGYLVAAITADENSAFQDRLAGWKTMLSMRVLAFAPGAPEYCVLG